MHVIRTVIVEDEPRSRNLLRGMIKEFCTDLTIVAEAEEIENAITIMERFRPDVLFMDVNLFGTPGFEILERTSLDYCQVIFTTAYDHYAIDAFRYDATDFLLKPIGPSDLKKAVEKVKRRLNYPNKRDNDRHHSLQEADARRLALPTLNGYVIREAEDILYIKADGNYCSICFINGAKILVSRSIQHYEDSLSSDRFFRVHKSYIVNLKQIIKYNKGRGGQVVLQDNTLLPVASRRKDAFLSQLNLL